MNCHCVSLNQVATCCDPLVCELPLWSLKFRVLTSAMLLFLKLYMNPLNSIKPHQITHTHRYQSPRYAWFFPSRSMNYSLVKLWKCQKHLTILEQVIRKILDVPLSQICSQIEWFLSLPMSHAFTNLWVNLFCSFSVILLENNILGRGN